MKTAAKLAAFAAAALAAAECAALTGFGTDYEAAAARARANGRDMVVLFTGSDWCPYCVKLEREVLSQREFLDYATNRYELVEIDFPKDASRQTESVRAANQALAKRFEVRGYPTVVLADPDGKVLFTTGYSEGGAERWVDRFRAAADVLPLVEKYFGPLKSEADALKKRLLAAVNAQPGDGGWSEVLKKTKSEAKAILPAAEALRSRIEATDVPDAAKAGKEAVLKHVDALINAAKSIGSVPYGGSK
jgi:thiol-disulfide isomerase/thioredoxin